MYHPRIFSDQVNLIAAQSHRTGGVSAYPAGALNLGLYTDDFPGAVQENRKIFADVLGVSSAQFVGSHQVHGSEVALVERTGELTGYDALITNRPGIILTITTADCLPVLICDPVNLACGAAHAGWRGTAAEIARKTLTAMQENFGSEPAECLAYIGPGISYDHFEVGPEVGRQFPARYVKAGQKAGKFLVDLKSYNLDQLTGTGIPTHRIEVSPECTVADNDRYFSYRKEAGKTGRMLTVIGFKVR